MASNSRFFVTKTINNRNNKNNTKQTKNNLEDHNEKFLVIDNKENDQETHQIINKQIKSIEKYINHQQKANRKTNTENESHSFKLNDNHNIREYQQEIDTLKTSLKLVISEKDDYKMKFDDEKSQNKILYQQIECLENHMIRARDHSTKGFQPNLNGITFVRLNDSKATELTNNLRINIISKYPAGEYHLQFKTKDNKYRKPITAYLKFNKLYTSNPIIQKFNDDKQYKSNELITKYKIKKHKFPELIGQYGVKTKVNINEIICIGQFTGTEYENNEYESIYSFTEIGCIKDLYAFNMGPTENGDMIVLDTKEAESENVLNFINDCRKDIKKDQRSKKDKNTQNASLVEVKVNGWPTIFVIIDKTIPKNKEIFAYYGPHYKEAMRNYDLFQKRQEDDAQTFDKHIIDPYFFNPRGSSHNK